MPVPKLLISLHDATPFHLDRMRKAESVFGDLGLRKVTYLFVPEYHGGYPSGRDGDFREWCRATRPFEVEWFLHGYHHLESPPEGKPAGTDSWKRRFLTAGEGEFLALEPAEQRRKLDAGREMFRQCLDRDPPGFVAPAWLFNPGLIPLLRELGMRFTEDHGRVYQVDAEASIPCPVITWATRTPLRKYGSLLVCPALARLWRNRPVLRVAVHPFDFDHPATVRSIRRVLGSLLTGREQAFSRDLDFGSAGPS